MSKVISFRFSGAKLEALEALSSSNDASLSQTASRLLSEVLGFSDPHPSTVVDASTTKELINREMERILGITVDSVGSVDIQDLVERKVESAIAEIGQAMVKREVESAIAEVKQDLNERLGELAA